MIVQTVHDLGSSANVHNATVLRAQSTLEEGSWGSLDILAAPACNRVIRYHQKRTKYQDLHPPLIAVAVLRLY